MLRFPLLALAVVLAALAAPAPSRAEEAGAATARWRAAVDELPEPATAGGVDFEGVITAGGTPVGRVRVSARPARPPQDPEAALGWEVRHEETRGEGEDAVVEAARAYLDRTLAPLAGSTERTEEGEGRRWSWSRQGGRVRIVATGHGQEERVRTLDEGTPSFATFAAVLLFARYAPAQPAVYAARRLRPTFEVLLGEDPYEPTTLDVRGAGTWREAPAFLVVVRTPRETVTLALEPRARAVLGWHVEPREGPSLDILPRDAAAAPALDALFVEPATTAKAAAVRAAYAFATGDMTVLGAVIHWPTLRRRMGDQVPASVTPEAFRDGLLKRIAETTVNPQPPARMAAVLQGLLADLPEEAHGQDVKVTFPAMFRALVVTVARIEGTWYLVELPTR